MNGDDKHLARDQRMHVKNLRVNLKNKSRMYNFQTHADGGGKEVRKGYMIRGNFFFKK